MKRSIAILLGLPLFVAVGCSSDDTDTTSNSFGLNYELGTYVVLDGKEFTETKRYVDLDGKVTQVNDLSATPTTTAAGGVCQLDLNETKTVSATEVTSTSKVRIAGRQQSWILPGSYGTAPGEGDVHVYGDPQNGQLYVNKPTLDIFVGTQANAQCNCRLDQYEKLTPVDLYVFEEDKNSASKTTDVTTTGGAASTKATTVTIDDTSTAARRRALTTFARFSLGDYVWQTTGSLAGLYTASPLNYNANMIVPNSVAVGDTWIDNNGSLVGAVGIEAVEVAGKNYAALHVVERGSTDIDLTAQGLKGWCINYYENANSNVGGGSVSKDSEITDMCNSTGAGVFSGQGVNGKSTGWTNIRHTWYYEGLPIKIEETTVDVDVKEWGYNILNDGTLPAAPDQGAVNQCGRYYENTPSVLPADISKYKPYALFSVSKTTRTFVASEIRAGYNLVQEYKEAKAASAAAE